MVKFVIDSRTPIGRLGHITEWGRARQLEPNFRHDTPSFLVYTRIGHIPHLTWDVADKFLKFSQLPILQFTLPAIFDQLSSVEKFGKGIAKFCGTPQKYPIHISLIDPLGRLETGYNDTYHMAISWHRGGRRSVSATNLLDILETCHPDSFTTTFDYDLPRDAQNKRLSKAVSRTTTWIESTFRENPEKLESAFLGLSGGFSAPHRIAMVMNLSKKAYADGFSLDLLPFTANKKITFAQEFDEIEIEKLIAPVITELPETKPRLIEGSFTPSQIWFLIGLGIDLFDSSYAIQLAEENKALRITDAYPINLDYTTLDFNETKYADDFSPLFEGCKCYACSNYTKGYLQHLANTNEMLGTILLVIHNLTEWDRMFQLIRKHLPESIEEN